MPKTYTVKEVADILGFSTNSIYTFLKEKRIKGVRVGKGRFRIPDEELSRILHLSKKSQTTPGEQATPVIFSNESMPRSGDAAILVSEYTGAHDSGKKGKLPAPNLFDWFVGLAAIEAGAALFLFNSSVSSSQLARFSEMFPFIRIVLIAAGLGIIISGDFVRNRIWHVIFQFSLVVMGFVNAFGLMRSGDMEGAGIYGSMALVTGVVMFLPFGGIVSVLMYATLLALCFPLMIFFFPTDLHVSMFTVFTGIPVFWLGVIAIALAVVIITGLWVGYAKHRWVFIGTAILAAICSIVLAIFYAHMQFWSRSLFLTVVGFFIGVLPYWWPLQQSMYRRYKMMLHGILICVGAMFLISILVVYLLQHNLWQSKESDFFNKIKIAQSQLESATTTVQGSLSVAANNPDFVATIIQKDLPRLTANAKIIYESNPNIRRLVFLDKDGKGIALYPYGTFDTENLAFREYFQIPKQTGKPYVSDVFKSLVDNEGRYVATVSVPIYDTKGVFAGVIDASLALDRMTLQLSQIAASNHGEYFVVVDSKGIIISHPDLTLIGTQAPETDPLNLGLRGKIGVKENVFIDKSHGMIAYAQVPSLRWAISLRAVSGSIFELAEMTVWMIFGTVTCILIAAIAVIAFVSSRTLYEKESGP